MLFIPSNRLVDSPGHRPLDHPLCCAKRVLNLFPVLTPLFAQQRGAGGESNRPKTIIAKNQKVASLLNKLLLKLLCAFGFCSRCISFWFGSRGFGFSSRCFNFFCNSSRCFGFSFRNRCFNFFFSN